MRENTDQKNSKYGHFSRSVRNKNYATVISQPLNGGIKSKNIEKLTKNNFYVDQMMLRTSFMTSKKCLTKVTEIGKLKWKKEHELYFSTLMDH